MQSTKRAAEDFARSHDTSSPNKKPRFDIRNPSALAPDALENDEVLDADVIGARGQQVRRGAVNVDGYDSDSDNENFDARADAKFKAQEEAKKSKDEEDADMFADLEDDFKDGDDSEGDVDRRGAGRKKGVRFLDEDEIEGQVKSSKSGGHVSADFSLNGKKGKQKAIDDEVESSTDSEVDDETRADTGDVDEEVGAGGKKNHAPKLDAFNMRNENEEGKFDESGNYVRKAVDPDAKHDVWLDGISKKDMKKASEAHEKREKERRRKAIEDDAKSDGSILASLLPLLHASETILEALARLHKEKKPKPKWQQNKKKRHGMTDDEPHAADEEKERDINQAIESITEAADLLLDRGQPEIYDTEKELLMRQYQKATGKEWKDASMSDAGVGVAPTHSSNATSPHQWEYRWSDARDGGETHGPYDTGTMKSWSDAGYFGQGVEFRRTDHNEWKAVEQFD